MVTSISLGSLFQSGGKNVFGGGASGLDTATLIKDLVEARRIPAVLLEDKLEVNAKKSTAFTEFQTLLANFKTAANFLRNPPGIATADQNIFQFRSVDAVTNTGVAASTFLSITAQAGADIRTSEIEINTVAKATVKTSAVLTGVADLNADVVEAAATANRFTAGNLELKPGVTVALAAGDSLNDILTKVNAVKGTTGVEAVAIKTADQSYVLQLRSTQTGIANAFDVNVVANTDPGGVLESLGNFTNTQAAGDASFTLDGVTITGSTNTFTDAIRGVTIALKQPTAGVEITAEIKADTSLVQQGVENFINAFNELRVFVTKQNQRDSAGNPLEDSVLISDRTIQTVMNRLDTQLTRIVDGIQSGAASFSEIGISFTDFAGNAETPAVKNILKLDTAKFAEAIADDYNAVRKVFEFDFVADSTKVRAFSRTNAASISEFTLDIDKVAGTASATFDDNGTPKTIVLDYIASSNGATIKGKTGTELEGLVMLYAADPLDTTLSINVNMTQGIADSMYNILNDMTDPIDGLVTRAISDLTESDESINERIGRIDEQIERFRQQLIDQFAALEQAISMTNQLLQSLDAQSNARNNQ